VSRPRSIILLIVWFLWATGKDLDALARYSTTSNYYVFSATSLAWLFFALAAGVFLLNAASVFYLFRPQPVGYPVLLAALAAGTIQNVVTLALAINNVAGVRQAYEIGRELRGLPVRQEAMDMIFTPTAMLVASALSLAVYCVLAWLVYRNRLLFLGPVGHATEA
jgi:hypothetical protein